MVNFDRPSADDVCRAVSAGNTKRPAEHRKVRHHLGTGSPLLIIRRQRTGRARDAHRGHCGSRCRNGTGRTDPRQRQSDPGCDCSRGSRCCRRDWKSDDPASSLCKSHAGVSVEPDSVFVARHETCDGRPTHSASHFGDRILLVTGLSGSNEHRRLCHGRTAEESDGSGNLSRCADTRRGAGQRSRRMVVGGSSRAGNGSVRRFADGAGLCRVVRVPEFCSGRRSHAGHDWSGWWTL